MNLAGVGSLTPISISGTWWRAVQVRHLPNPLGTTHTNTTPGRFNAGTTTHPGMEVLYLTEDLLVAQFEVGALLGSPIPGHSFVPNPLAVGWSFLPMTVSVGAVADVTSPPELVKLDTSVQELTGDWRGYGLRLPPVPALTRPHWSNVPTHRLAHEIHAAKTFEGLLTFSAKVPTKRNLVLFPNRLKKPSFVSYTDPAGTTVQIP